MSRPSARLSAGAALAAAALAAAGAVRADEPPPAGGGPLRVAADPPRLELGRDASAELRVTAPPEVDEVAVTASVGRVEGIRRLPGGGFTARYRPPAERVPQVAIVSAVARTHHGFEDGWIAIPLSGEGDARVRAAPGSEVTLRIGDRTFGPGTANGEGVAIIPVIVPPGVREAHQGFRPIDLRVPETPLLHAVQDRTAIHADREEKVRVVAYVVAPHGAARRGDLPTFEPSRGTVAVSEREAGAFQAVWTLPPGPAGEERLSIRLPAAAASRAVLRVEGAAGPPAIVAVSFDRDALVAGGDAVVTARVLDAGGNQVPGELSLSARGASLSGVEARRPGELVARLAAGTRLDRDEVVRDEDRRGPGEELPGREGLDGRHPETEPRRGLGRAIGRRRRGRRGRRRCGRAARGGDQRDRDEGREGGTSGGRAARGRGSHVDDSLVDSLGSRWRDSDASRDGPVPLSARLTAPLSGPQPARGPLPGP